MTYFGFVTNFLILPILALSVILWRGKFFALRQGSLSIRIIALLATIALIYTTPWDNYLVANQVWWYNPERVAGITIGWVPIEEYAFFVLQTMLSGLWLSFLIKTVKLAPAKTSNQKLNRWAAIGASLFWLCAGFLLFTGWPPGTYISLILFWALPPVILQVGYGADILWRQRAIVLPAVLIATLYLSFADGLAIRTGIWTINPQLSLGLHLAGILPIEESIFFLFTNILVVFGLTLSTAVESRERIKNFAPLTILVKFLEIK